MIKDVSCACSGGGGANKKSSGVEDVSDKDSDGNTPAGGGACLDHLLCHRLLPLSSAHCTPSRLSSVQQKRLTVIYERIPESCHEGLLAVGGSTPRPNGATARAAGGRGGGGKKPNGNGVVDEDDDSDADGPPGLTDTEEEVPRMRYSRPENFAAPAAAAAQAQPAPARAPSMKILSACDCYSSALYLVPYLLIDSFEALEKILDFWIGIVLAF